MPTPSNDLKARYEDVRSRIDAAAAKAGRRGDDIVLVAVTKNASIDVVRQLLALGHQDFGENRVQQLVNRATQVGEFRQRLVDHPEAAAGTELVQPRWHMIGHLQRNKAKKVAGLIRLVHSVDSLRLVEELHQPVGHDDGVRSVGRGLEQDRELVSTETDDEVTRSHSESQPVRDHDKEFVTAVVAE